MDYMISREVKDVVSPFVYDAIFKKVGKNVKDCTLVRIWVADEGSTSVTFNVLDPRKPEIFIVKTMQYHNDNEVYLVLLKVDDKLAMMTVAEAESMVRNWLAAHGTPNDKWKLVEVV